MQSKSVSPDLGCAVLAATISATFVLAILGTVVFPKGKYPVILLALPGVAAGIVIFFILGLIVERLPRWLALVLCTLLTVLGISFGAHLVKAAWP